MNKCCTLQSIRSYYTVEWFGASQIMQYQETDEFASLEYSCVLIPVHDAWYHVSHSSQASAFSTPLHALEQVLHGYLGGLGPGLVSIPAIIRSAILYRLVLSWLFMQFSLINSIGKFLLEKCCSSGTKQHFLLPSPTELPRIYFSGPVCQIGSPAAYILYEILDILVAHWP